MHLVACSTAGSGLRFSRHSCTQALGPVAAAGGVAESGLLPPQPGVINDARRRTTVRVDMGSSVRARVECRQ